MPSRLPQPRNISFHPRRRGRQDIFLLLLGRSHVVVQVFEHGLWPDAAGEHEDQETDKPGFRWQQTLWVVFTTGHSEFAVPACLRDYGDAVRLTSE